MAIAIRRRRDSTANWTANNPILEDGQLGFELTASGEYDKFKIGDGKTRWNDLKYSFDYQAVKAQADIIIGNIGTSTTKAAEAMSSAQNAAASAQSAATSANVASQAAAEAAEEAATEATELAVADIQEQFNAVIKNITVDSEVILARGAEATLANRLSKSEEQINTLDALKADQTDLESEILNRTNSVLVEKSERLAEVEVERQRINSFTALAVGSTTGDAELIDARVGTDGITYPNVGSAVRGQVDKLKSDLDNYSFIKESYTFNSGIGATRPYVYIDATENMQIQASAGIGYNVVIIEYSDSNHTTSAYDSGWKSEITRNCSPTKYVKVGGRKTDDSIVASGDLANFSISVIKNVKTYIGNTTNLLNNDIDAIGTRVGSPKIEISFNNGVGGIRPYYLLGKWSYPFHLSTDGNFSIGIQGYSDSGYSSNISDTGWKKSIDFTPTADVYYKLMGKQDANSIVTSNDLTNFHIFIECPVDYALSVNADDISTNAEAIDVLETELLEVHTYDSGSPFNRDRFYAHLFLSETAMPSGDEHQVIPSQSIFDVQISDRLGFNIIEGNVRKTSDGKYIVIHGGGGGTLGSQVVDVNGDPATNVVIANTTLADIQNNYHYRSKYAKYRTSIPTLETFLLECRMHNMTPLLQWVDVGEIEIIKKIMGNNFIQYDGLRTTTDGMIMKYGNAPTLATVIGWCDTIKPPLMVCIADTDNIYTDADLDDLVEACHTRGVYIGYTNNYKNPIDNLRVLKHGFDFASSGWDVNDFNYGNLIHVSSDVDFSDFTHTGSVLDGKLFLENGDTVQLTTQLNSCFLAKGILDVVFDGSIGLSMGKYIDVKATDTKLFTSDSKNSIRFSTMFLELVPDFTITASGNVVISQIMYKASRC